MSNHNPPANGFDKRKSAINRKGRPKSFDALRELALEIAHEPVQTKDGQPLLVNGKQITVTEFVIRRWFNSSDPRQQQAAMEIAYGKVPTVVTGKDGGPIELRVIYDDKPGSAPTTSA